MSTLSEKQMLDVMAYADGELASDDASRVRSFIDGSAEARELLASVRAIGDGVRSAAAPAAVDVTETVMRRIQPNDLDKARIRRTNRVRMGVVAASLVALAAAVVFYVRQNAENPQGMGNPVPTNSILPIAMPSEGNALASLATTGVEVDSVDTPSPVSVFYVPTDNPELAAKGGGNTVVVWVDDSNGDKP